MTAGWVKYGCTTHTRRKLQPVVNVGEFHMADERRHGFLRSCHSHEHGVKTYDGAINVDGHIPVTTIAQTEIREVGPQALSQA